VSQAEADRLCDALREIADAAGKTIMAHYRAGAPPSFKADRSPVTAADLEADRLIVAALRALTPDLPIVSEEGAPTNIAGATHFWLVDPLDGTKEFIAGIGEFTVNIGLIEGIEPLLGIVHVPSEKVSFVGRPGAASWWRDGARQGPLAVRPAPARGAVVLASRFHRGARVDAFVDALPGATIRTAGSALKFGLLARGEADYYPRFGRTMEWDTAAGHAVLNAAGGSVRTADGQALRYRKPAFANGDFVAYGQA
jgi:3'(2'), 5'-bisphosphate nucleotidase